MATFIGSPAFLAHPVAKPQFSCAQSPRPQAPQQHQEQTPQQMPMQTQPQPQQPPPVKPKRATSADSTDWIASSLTRRFGIGAGLAWVGFLATGVVSEQVKTRFEVAQQQANTKDVEQQEEMLLPNGIRYYDIRVGGGDIPQTGDLVVIDLQGRVVGGDVFVDTFAKEKRPLALVMGSRPYTKGMCEGVEYVLRSMRAGGKRRVMVPPSLGFGDDGADFGSGARIPPGATLEFVVQVDRVSIAPS